MSRFPRAYEAVRVHEGGFVDHPDDPGGRTNKGVTQRTYDSWRRRRGYAPKDVLHISDDEVRAIYRGQYWSPVRGDDLPAGIAYLVFDAAINSGPGRAIRWLQSEIGAKVDGVVGEETIGLAREAEPRALIRRYNARRLDYVRGLPHWRTFGRGWRARIEEVTAQALAWVVDDTQQATSRVEAPGKAEGRPRVTRTLADALTDREAIGAVGGLVGSVGTLASGSGPVQYALAAVLVMAVLAAVVLLLRRAGES